jgi:integrase
MAKLNFTKAALFALPSPPKGKRAYYRDTQTRGLTLSVTESGTKSYLLYRKIHGKPEKVFIARFGDISVEEARNRATKLNAEIACGDNPAHGRRLARAEMTLEELFQQYIDRHAKVNTKRWREAESKFKQYLDRGDAGGIKLSDRRISSLRRADIALLHSKISASHPVTANRVLALVSSVFGWAIKTGLWEERNPASGIPRNRERSRDRFLQAAELPRFFRALSEETNETVRDFILISLFTGARQGNVLNMKWAQVDLADRLWRIPETKNGTPHVVPLTKEALAVLGRRRLQANAWDEFVFPAASKFGHLVYPQSGWRRVLKRAGIQGLRLHDLRRTLGSWREPSHHRENAQPQEPDFDGRLRASFARPCSPGCRSG